MVNSEQLKKLHIGADRSGLMPSMKPSTLLALTHSASNLHSLVNVDMSVGTSRPWKKTSTIVLKP